MRSRHAIFQLAGALYSCSPENLDIFDCIIQYALLLPSRAQKRLRNGATRQAGTQEIDTYIRRLCTLYPEELAPLNSDQILGFIKLLFINLRRIKKSDQDYINSVEYTRAQLRKYLYWLYLKEDLLDELPQRYEREFNGAVANRENNVESIRKCDSIWCAINRYILHEVEARMQEFIRRTQFCKLRYTDIINTIKISIGSVDNSAKCAVCMDKTPNMAFPRCGHLCVCITCAYCLDRCPMCRSVGNAIRIYTN
jgi:hypothetical protein